MIRTQRAALAQSVARFSEEIMLNHKGSDGSPAEDALGVTGRMWRLAMRPPSDSEIFRKSKSPRPVSRRGLNSCDAEHMPVICPTCQIFSKNGFAGNARIPTP